MFGSLLLLLAQAATSPPPPVASGEVTVIARRAEKELAACLARQCPPAQEVEASLQASVEQFADARYIDARRTLQDAIRRNKRYAADMPGPVSSLYATLATVAEHEGDARLWKTASRNNVLLLREHLGNANTATLTEELTFADDLIGQGETVLADDLYEKVQRLAADHGHADLAAGAAFRRAWLALAQRRFHEAQRFADDAVALAGPGRATMTELREIVLTRIAVRKGDEGAVDALAARLRRAAGARPVLMFAPPILDINPPREQLDARPVMRDGGIRFADIGYWIRPDGKVADAEMLRTNGLGQWAPGILSHVRARRYIPTQLTAGQPGVYRIDRYTVRGTMGTPLGTRIRQRMGDLSVHVVDLTDTEAMSAAHRTRVAQGMPVSPPAMQP